MTKLESSQSTTSLISLLFMVSKYFSYCSTAVLRQEFDNNLKNKFAVLFLGANILMDLKGDIKLADFGAAKQLRVCCRHAMYVTWA